MNAKDPSVSPELTRAIADFAFASQGFTHGSRPLAWLTPDELKIDLDDPAQRRFGDYELLERIGQGGMGVVYRAKQHGLDRDVAVKLLAAGPWASDEFVSRFRREARHAARMQHPNIVEIYEFGHRDGLNYFSMRLVEGLSLAQRIAGKGPMAEVEAAKCARLLAEAMDYAHRLDVLHLDLKPANVLIGQNGEPLIADFGLARRVDAGGAGGNEEISGTPSYMAPEQAVQQSHPLSASTDIYGLGAILYEMLTGRPPFRGNDVQATLDSVVSQPPTAPRSIRAGLSRDLEAICLRCLEKQPIDRYATSRELADDLQRFLDGHVVSARPLDTMQRLGRWIRREPRLATAVGAALFALALGGAATAFAWQKAMRAQADAEYLGLSTLLPAADNVSIYKLSSVIREHLSSDARQELAKKLARSSDPHDWLAAGLVARTYFEPQADKLGDEQIRRAVEAMPQDRIALMAAIRYCRSAFIREEGSTFELPAGCPVPDAPERLARMEPQNLYAWTSQIDRPLHDQNDVGRLIWKYDHDPATRTRLRNLVARAARSTTWDAGGGEMYAIKGKAYGVDYFPMPSSNRFYGGAGDETQSADHLMQGLQSTWVQAWWIHRPYFGVLQRICDPSVSTVDDSMRADCTRIFRMLAESKDETSVTVEGLRGLYTLADDPLEKAAVDARFAQRRWLREQDIWARERDPLGRGKQYTQDFLAHGEWEASLREAEHVGISRQPPDGWTPLDPTPWRPFFY